MILCCRTCGSPMELSSDIYANYDCEACETIICSCGSISVRGGFSKTECLKCGQVLELDFTGHIEVSDEGMAGNLKKVLRS